MTTSVSSVALTRPPTMGAAIRRITSEPVPLTSMIGSRPAMVAATVIKIGRSRSSAPSMTACCTSAAARGRAARRAPSIWAVMAWFR